MAERAVDADGDLGVVITGDHNHNTTILGDVILRGPSKAPPSVYEAEIRILAAAHFEGRQEELAAMGAFALGEDPTGTGYWRWLAPAWSGKTALMAQFALNPPDTVDVLAFFITARLAGRSDRTAFLATLRQQLRAYLEDNDVDCDDYGGFHDALRRAAERATHRGRRLALVVDGMDEDSGVESAFAGYSIAGLLPGTPPDGMCVIVAGRPNPPVPSDVPAGHPLRDTRVNHDLAESPAARAVRVDAERSLDAMITAGGLSLDLVGLTAAAGGGLSADDFAVLARDRTARHVESVLGGATGRSFQLRPAQWTLGDGRHPHLYSFAHQELLISARQLLRPSVLDAYRTRVHDFIDVYRGKGWPADTPEYALTGYPQMLREHRDTARLTRLATDPARHERLWLTTGSDTLALTEIADAFALHEAEPEADLVACVRLSYCRDELRRKALSFPSSAIAVLAKLGHCHKAAALLSARVAFSSHETDLFTFLLKEALAIGEEDVVLNAAHGLVQPSVRDRALKHCTVALAGADQVDRGIELTRSISDAEQRCDAFVFMAWRLLDRGQRDAALRPVGEAAHAARSVEAPTRRAMALTLVARAMMDAERPRAAVDLAREAAIVVDELNVTEDREQSLGPVAVVLARAGHAGDAIRLVGTIVDAERRAWALADVAETLVKTEESETAVGLARQVAEEARKLRHELVRESLLERAAIVLTRAERTDDAVQLVCRVGDGERRAKALARMAETLAEIGKSEAAAGLACDAAEVAGAISPEDQRMDALKRAATASVRAGQLDDAVGLASSIEASGQRAELLCAVALAMVETGHLEQAVPQCLAAVVLSDDIADDTERIAVLLSVSRVFDEAGETDTAIRYARRAADAALTADAAEQRARALVQTAEMLINSGQRDEAARCVDLAIDVARFAPDPKRTASRTLGVARALIGAGRMGEAEALVSSAVDLVSSPVRPARQAQMLCEAARLLTDLNRTDKALQLAVEAVHRGRGDIDPDDMVRALADVAGALAEKGRTSEAVQLTGTAADLARATTNSRWRAWALRDVATALAKAARIEESIELAEAITESGDRATAMAALTEMLAKTGRAEEAARLAQHAVSVARSEPNAGERCAALAAVAASMVATGQSDEAVSLADALVEEHSTLTSGDAAVGVACVAEALAQAGRTSEAVRLAERAAQLARATTEIFGQDKVLSLVVNALVKAGQLAQAVRAANTISDPARRAPALAKTAAAYGLTAEGRSLLRRALSLHSHGAFLQDLAAVAPEALDEAVHRIQAGKPGDA